MQTPALLLSLLVFSTALQAQPSLENARRAQALLGSATWSQVIRVENQARSSAYPQTVHALVFEFEGILWFYTDTNGTQSFSLHHDNLAAEKADFGPLLRGIEPGFGRWTVLPFEPVGTAAADSALPNGCFIESIAALQLRLATGAVVHEPRLLSYYAKTTSGRLGHTVLTYRSGGTLEIFDPARPSRPIVLPVSLARDPVALARELEGVDVVKARFVPVSATATPVLAARSTSSSALAERS